MRGTEREGEGRRVYKRRGEERRSEENERMNDCEWRTKSQVQGKRRIGRRERTGERGTCECERMKCIKSA